MTVLLVAYPLAPVSLDAAGGAEQIVAMLDRALTAAGHHTIVAACAGSQAAGDLVSFPIAPGLNGAARAASQLACHGSVSEALRRWPVDIVHMHGLDFYEYLPPPGLPVLVTLHLPVTYYPASVFVPSRARTWLNCVSTSQRRTCPPSSAILPTVENGIPLELFPGDGAAPGDYVLALGRICPEKGFHLAIDAAARAGAPLWLAGQTFPYPEHVEYFQRQLAPRLQPPHRYLGPVGFQAKCKLLGEARCLVAPSLAAETSSLVAMEAMACGAPVVAFRAGALPEVVEDGITGFLVDDVDLMAQAIGRAPEIRRGACRRAARGRFSATRMAEQYLSLYETCISTLS